MMYSSFFRHSANLSLFLLLGLFVGFPGTTALAQNVGIGTSTPATKLDVNGVITATGGTSSDWNNAVGWGDHDTVGYLTGFTEVDPQVGPLAISNVPRWAGSFLANGQIRDNGTNVGIGASPVGERLYVAGNTRVSGTSYLIGNVGIGTSAGSNKLAVVGGESYFQQNVGIGITNPSYPLHVSGTGYITNNLGIGAPPAGERLYVAGNTRVTGTGYILGNVGIGTAPGSNKLTVVGGETYFQQNVGIGVSNPAFRLHVSGDGYITNDIGIGTTPVGANRLSVVGGESYFQRGVGIDISNPNYALHVEDGPNTGGRAYIEGNVGIGTTPAGERLRVGVFGNGTAIANVWTTYSDLRYKEAITSIANPLELVMALRGVNYQWKESGSDDIGFIAQEVETVLPVIVYTDDEGYKSVDYARVNAVLVEAIKEQQHQIESLQKRLDEKDRLFDHLSAQVRAMLDKSGERVER